MGWNLMEREVYEVEKGVAGRGRKRKLMVPRME